MTKFSEKEFGEFSLGESIAVANVATSNLNVSASISASDTSTSSTAGAGVQTSSASPTTSQPTTETSASVPNTELVVTTVLAATADTEVSSPGNVKLNLSPISTTEQTSAEDNTNLQSISASLLEPDTPTSTVSSALIQILTSDQLEATVLAESDGIGQKVAINVLEKIASVNSDTSASAVQADIDFITGADGKSSAQDGNKQIFSIQTQISDSITEAMSLVAKQILTSQIFNADVFTETIAGDVTTVDYSPIETSADTVVTANAPSTKLLLATVLAASADTAASSAGKLKLTLSPLDTTEETLTQADIQVQTSDVNPLFSESDAKSIAEVQTSDLNIDLFEALSETSATTEGVIGQEAILGEFRLGDRLVGGIARPLLQKSRFSSKLGDSETSAIDKSEVVNMSILPKESGVLSEVVGDGDITLANFNPIVSESIAEAIGATIQTFIFETFQGDADVRATAEAVAALAGFDQLDSVRILPDWTINQKIIESTIEDVRERETLTIVWRITKEDLEETLRPNLEQTGKLDIVDRIDGGFDTVSRRADQEPLTLRAETGRQDVRPKQDYYVNDFDEEPRGTEAESWEVEVEFIPEKEKHHSNDLGTLDPPPSYSDDPDQWYFEFNKGDILTRRVTTDVERSSENALVKAELTMILLPEEVRVLEENSGRIGAVNYREVPDGDDLYEDTTDNNLNTLTISPPDSAEGTLSTGDYIMTESFETTWNRGFYEVEFPIVQL